MRTSRSQPPPPSAVDFTRLQSEAESMPPPNLRAPTTRRMCHGDVPVAATLSQKAKGGRSSFEYRRVSRSTALFYTGPVY